MFAGGLIGKLRNKKAIINHVIRCHLFALVVLLFKCLAPLLGIGYKVKQLDLYNLRDTMSPIFVGLNLWDVPLPLYDHFQVFVFGWIPMRSSYLMDMANIYHFILTTKNHMSTVTTTISYVSKINKKLTRWTLVPHNKTFLCVKTHSVETNRYFCKSPSCEVVSRSNICYYMDSFMGTLNIFMNN